MDKLIRNFIEDSSELSKLYKEYDKEKSEFYDGGYSFEQCNEYLISNIEKLEASVKLSLIEIIKS